MYKLFFFFRKIKIKFKKRSMIMEDKYPQVLFLKKKKVSTSTTFSIKQKKPKNHNLSYTDKRHNLCTSPSTVSPPASCLAPNRIFHLSFHVLKQHIPLDITTLAI